MFLVVGETQSCGQFEIGLNVVISLAETGIGVERIRILAQEIIVPFIVQPRDRIGIDILRRLGGNTVDIRNILLIGPAIVQAIKIVRDARLIDGVATDIVQRNHRERVREHVIIFIGFVVQIIRAGAEIERAFEIRRQTEFLTDLPGMFGGQILHDEAVAAPKLRIAESFGGWIDLVARQPAGIGNENPR